MRIDDEAKDLVLFFINKAEQGEHKQFQFILTWFEYIRAKQERRALRLLIGSVRKSTKRLFKKYCRAVSVGTADVHQLLAYRKGKIVLKFYEEELNILSDMINEYEYYLASGNWTDFVLGTQRPVDKLWDHRG